MSVGPKPYSVKGVATSTAATVGTFAGYDGCKEILIELVMNGGETGGILLSADGSNFSAAIRPIDMSTGAVAGAATLASGFYRVTCPFSAFRITKSAAVQSCTVRYIAAF
jgi:hypothetical protein